MTNIWKISNTKLRNSCVVLLELRVTPNTDNKTIPTIPAEITVIVFIKQRYIWRLNNHRILAQASQKFFEKKSGLQPITKDKFQNTSEKMLYELKKEFLHFLED